MKSELKYGILESAILAVLWPSDVGVLRRPTFGEEDQAMTNETKYIQTPTPEREANELITKLKVGERTVFYKHSPNPHLSIVIVCNGQPLEDPDRDVWILYNKWKPGEDFLEYQMRGLTEMSDESPATTV